MASCFADDTAPTALTEYEKQRLENVKRNQAMIAALGIQKSRADLQLITPKKTEIKGFKRTADKRQREREEPVVTRQLRSSRISLTKSVDAQENDNPPPITEPVEDTLKTTRKPLPLGSVHIRGSSTNSFVNCLQGLDDDTPVSHFLNLKSSSYSDCILPSRFSLQKDDIARVVPGRIISVSFLPVSDRILVVAGDKGGHLGFWDVECDESEGDGVHLFQPHVSHVSGISVAPFSATKVFTCSYDATVKHLDWGTSMFDLVYCSEDDNILSAICSVSGSPHCAYVGEGEGYLKMLDTREKKATSSVKVHDKRLNTIDVNSQAAWLMVTSSSDATVSVWDARKLKHAGSSIAKIEHHRAVHSAYFSPTGSSIATCSYDNTVAVLRGFQHQGGSNASSKVHEKPTFIVHPNRNNRWIPTFRAIWGWDDEYVYVGNMKRTIDVISTSSKSTCHWLSSPMMTSIPCRLVAHPLRCGILAGCTAGGQVYVWRQ